MAITRLPESDVYKELDSSPAGLSLDEAHRRLTEVGPNTLRAVKGISLPRRFIKQFSHFLAVLLWTAAGLSFLADRLKPGEGMATLGWAILGVILINAIFSFIDRKSTRLNSSHIQKSRMPSSA